MKRYEIFFVSLLMSGCLSNAGLSPTVQSQTTGALLETTAPVVEITATPEAVTSPDYFNLPADSVELNATEEEINQKLQEIYQNSTFPLGYNESAGTYSQLCLVEKINFLKEGSYINFGDFDVRVTGECSYYDTNKIKQTGLVAMVVQNSVEKTTWMPYSSIIPAVVVPDFIQERFTRTAKIEPGMIISVDFNLPNATNLAQRKAAEHHGDAIEEFYSPEEIEAYVDLGNPENIKWILLPLSVTRSDLFNHMIGQ